MRAPLLRRLTAWLCLVLGLVSGFSPAQALVLCVEPEGGVSLELAFDGSGCDGCPASDERGARPDASQLSNAPADCACIDIPLATVVEQRRQQADAGHAVPDRHVVAWQACAAPWLPAAHAAWSARAASALAAPGSLHVARSVVLLV